MYTYDYLEKYNRKEKNVMNFISCHQGYIPIAKKLLKEYADKDRPFIDGTHLDHALLNETWDAQKTEHEIFKRMKFTEKVKWLLTRNR